MNKALVIFAVALSSLVLGCPDKGGGDGAKPAPSAAPAANAPAAPGAPAAPAPKTGGW
jgi:hypothetical protein